MTQGLARRAVSLALLAGAAMVALAGGGKGESSKKRAGPAEVAPVVMGGLRFEALLGGKMRGRGQNGGDIIAFDAATGAERWILRVYKISYSPQMEADKQDVYITSLRAAPDGRTLLVADERARRWRVDTAAMTVARDAD